MSKHKPKATFELIQPTLGEDKVWAGKSRMFDTYKDNHPANPPFYETNVLEIHVAKDGAVIISDDDDGLIYLYPQQVKHILAALRASANQIKLNRRGQQ
jgi:hypothetical protein